VLAKGGGAGEWWGVVKESDELEAGPVLVTGATGYIGGRLAPLLVARGYRVRCLVRDAGRLAGRGWVGGVEVVAGDVLRPESLGEALRGVRVAYYLIHSLGAGSGFEDRDVRAAENFAEAARAAGVERIIYLGGLAEASPELSEHLRSRQETGEGAGDRVSRRGDRRVGEFVV
jgi:uncharacterized protein YbjT (DUF2867 family)